MEESEGEWTGSDGVRDRKGRRRGHTMTVFISMKKHLLHGALRLGDPLSEPLKLRFVSLSSETLRSFGTTQSSISSHPAFPDDG